MSTGSCTISMRKTETEDGYHYDPSSSYGEIMKLLEEINARGTTVLVVTHDQAIVNTLKKRVIRMQKGIIVEDAKESGYIG